MNERKDLWIYILELENGNYYTGYTTNIVRRYQQHMNGKAHSKYTRSFKPVRIAQCWHLFDTVGTALKVERFIKKQNRKFKQFLVENPDEIKAVILSKLKLDLNINAFDPNKIERINIISFMHPIRNIESEKDQKQFINLAAYCFADETGWTQWLFPLPKEDRAIGFFNDETLTSALIIKKFQSSLFDEIVPSSGISAVVTSPQHRNRQQVRKLMMQVLCEDYEKETLFSTLYPFRFQFYHKFGYGSIGPTFTHIFNPKDIRNTHPPVGRFEPYDGNRKQFNEIHLVYNQWVQQFDFGVLRKIPLRHRFNNKLEFDSDKIFLYYNQNKNCGGFIRLHLETLAPFIIRLQVKEIAWKNVEAFSALMYLLWTHRDQCKDIQWTASNAIPINWMTNEPRIDRKSLFMWMARPLHIKKLLEMKADQNPINGKIIFSVIDEIITENSGTYIVEGNDVKQEPFRGENTLTLHLFSSLLFGGVSLKQSILAGVVNYVSSPEAEKFFSLNHNIYLTENF